MTSDDATAATLELATLAIDDPDGFYNELVALHSGLTEAQSAIVNWRLILILANQVGTETARKAVDAAKLPKRKPRASRW